jgi:hypothetical protein
MTLLTIILFAVAIILLGAVTQKPLGWIAIGFALLALLLALFGGGSIRIGAAPRAEQVLS